MQINLQIHDQEIKEILKTVKIVIDTREQKNNHILTYFDSKKISYTSKKLDFGDYTCEFTYKGQVFSLEKYFAIERKASLDELANNFTAKRTQFENEFLRAKGTKIILMIENCTYSDLIRARYRSQYNAKAFIASLNSFAFKYDFNYIFINGPDVGNFIYYQIIYFIRNFLKN